MVKGFKVTNPDMTCLGFQYELDKVFKNGLGVSVCNYGFHFCERANHCFNYYDFKSTNRVFEIEAEGVIKTEGDKSACSEIKFVRELSWQEVLGIVNTGSDNTGHSNTGDRNTGYWNTGNSNTGDRNTGYWNTGYWNTGNSNTGDRNTGYWNTGDRNTGYSNTGDRNTGAFCTGEAPFPIFNKPSGMTESQFKDTMVYNLLCQVDTKMWIQSSYMTDSEKSAHPSYATCEGFLRDIPFKEAFQNQWHNWSESNRKEFTKLENFDSDIFFEITGVKI